jgi:hypothetical protein
MSDKDQFTFEDEDDNLESSVTKKDEPQGPDEGGGENFFDTEEDLPGNSLGEQADTEKSDKGSEEFFFDISDETSESELEVQPELEPARDYEGSVSGGEDLFGDNLNAGFPEHEEKIDDPVDFAPEPQEKSSGSRNRTLLMLLLLVIVVAGGAYYFMGLGSSTPSVPTVKMPVETPAKAVAVPPPSAKVPAKKGTQEQENSVTVAVPPTAPAVVKTEAKSAPVETSKQEPTKPVSTSISVSPRVPGLDPVPVQSAPVVKEKAPKAPSAKPAETKTVNATKPVKAGKTVAVSKSVVAPKQVADGAYALDAGSYLLESNRKTLVAKIENLGYQPFVTPVDATIDMTRLRLGTHRKEDVQASLAFARAIEPGSYSVPAGDGYVIYAGTFLKTNNLETIKKRFLAEGLQVKSEPVQVVRTLSRVRFGSFASKEDAEDAASAVAKAGVKATIVKAK